MNIQRTTPAVLILPLALALSAAGCKSETAARSTRASAPEAPPATTTVVATPNPVRGAPPPAAAAGGTSDRGDRLLPPRPIGALAPEIAPTLPAK